MDAFDAVMAILYCSDGTPLSRVTIQKTLYLASRKIPTLKAPAYVMQYYGPYSEELGRALEKLVSFSFVAEKKMAGADTETYVYVLTTDGAKMAIRLTSMAEYHTIQSVVEACKDVCSFRAGPLAYASKILYLTEQGMPYRTASSSAQDSGWNLYPAGFEEGVRLLERLGLSDG